MSFVKKAVKKVFRAVKKVGSFFKRALKNKWVQTALLVGASFFTAGLAAGGGWAAFSSSMSAATAAGSSSIGAFFSTVGSTIATGFSSVMSSVGSLFKAGGTSTIGGTAGTGAASLIPSTSQITAAINTTISAARLANASTLTKVATGFGNLLTSNSVGGTALRGAIVGGIQMYSKNKELEMEEEYRRSRTVWGGPAFGGSSEPSPGLIRRPVFGGNMPAVAEADSDSSAEPIKRVDPYGSIEQAQGLLGKATPIEQQERQGQPYGLLGGAAYA